MIDRFRDVDEEIKISIAAESSKLKLGMCVLVLAYNLFGMEYLSANEIVEALDKLGVAVDRSNLLRAFARAQDRLRIITQDGEKKYKVMTKGRQEVEEILSISGPQVIYIQGDQPRTIRKKISDMFSGLQGEVLICDPYYGLRSLDILEQIPKSCDVRFLTAKTSEKKTKLQNAINDFIKENPKIEIRIYPTPQDLHDRYLIDQDSVWFLGHGIKDVGNKESFIIRIGNQIASDQIVTLREGFDKRWSKSTRI